MKNLIIVFGIGLLLLSGCGGSDAEPTQKPQNTQNKKLDSNSKKQIAEELEAKDSNSKKQIAEELENR